MKRVTRPEDLDDVHAITRGLLGQVCWQAILTFPSQVQLHWGERLAYESERLKGEYRGTWIFGAQSSSWTLRCNDDPVVGSDDDDAVIMEKIRVVEGAKTDLFQVAYPELTVTIRFSNGCTVLLTPDPEEVSDGPDVEPIEDWTLFYPDNMWLGVGPGPIWKNYRADQPRP